MVEDRGYWSRFAQGRLSRRRALAGAASLGIGAAALGVVGCGGDDGDSATGARREDEGTPRPGGIWRQATITDPTHFSPFHPGADPSFANIWRRANTYYDQMWDLRETDDPSRLIQLRLADKLEQPDETTVIVTLKRANFQNQPLSRSNSRVNGRQLTAEDVVARFEYLKVPPASANNFIRSGQDLKSVTAVDELTVRFETYGPRAFFFEGGLGVNTRPYEVPREMLDEQTLRTDVPIGTGPFMYKSHQAGSREEVVRNPNYFMKDRPYLEGRTLTLIPDAAAGEAAFLSGQIDDTSDIGFQDIKQRDRVAGQLGNRIKVTSYPSTSGMALLLNKNRAPFSDIRVREAIHRAIDVDRIANIVFFGDAMRTWWFPEGRPERFPLGFKGVEKYVGYDPQRATQLLRAANVDPNREFEFMVPPEAQTWVDGGRLAAEDLAKVGLKTRLNPIVRNIYLQRAGPQPGDFEITMTVFLDYQFATSDSGSFWNNAGLGDAEIDALVARISETVDVEKRKELSHQFEMKLAEKYANLVPMLTGNIHVGHYAYMKGIDHEVSRSGFGGWQIGRWMDRA
jgi:peptide/nickel transport system substrate-binding protein